MKFNLPGTVGQHGRSTGKERTWKLFWSYLPDWILTIFLWVSLLVRCRNVTDVIGYLLPPRQGMLLIVILKLKLTKLKIDGYRRLFSITDTSLAHPFAVHERVPVGYYRE